MAKKQLTEIKRERANKLCNHFLNEIGIDILDKTKAGVIPHYRALFNKLLARKYLFRPCEIQKFYEIKGVYFDHNTIRHSLKNYKQYIRKVPELNDIFFELHPSAKKRSDYQKEYQLHYTNSKKLTPIQQLVSNLTEEQEKDLTELITLRKKSWEWKSRDKQTIYESY